MWAKYVATCAALLYVAEAYPSSQGSKFSWADTKYMFAFGDSYTYVQGTHGRQNYSFIGDAFNLPFNPSDLLSNRIVQNQTSTAEGGPNWIEYLTGCGLELGLTDPRTCSRQLWDFAFAGSDISTEYTPLHHNYTVSLVNQTIQFEKYANPVLEKFVDKSRTLVAVWIGINDINDSDSYAVDFPTFYNQLISTLFERVERIYQLGYKKFLFVNLPPLDRTPANVGRTGGPLPNATMVGWWDQALAEHSKAFGNAHGNAWTRVFDANSFLNGVMDQHDKYGIKNVTGYCASYDQPFVDTDPGQYGCLPLEKYFWFNTGHMTSHVHQILAAEMKKYLISQS